ncbi:permease [Bacillus shivajii]|uniref:permease n=1 Tax=Bacillus shivajii TaxID=1983719 RepID=UPI001CFB20A1|nr:permease [Bacillus shivajii]UCZ54209.1 permease [Bacillus shivajii]
MIRRIEQNIVEITGFLILALVLYLVVLNGGAAIEPYFFPQSILAFNTIFLSILIEAIPFVLVGVFIAGMIQVFVTEEHIKRLIPKNRLMAVCMSCVVGALFPACECGIVPIVRRLVSKGIPIFAGVGFLLTGPLINPIVIFSTYVAFGQDVKMALLRMVLGLMIALIITAIISLLFRRNQLKHSTNVNESNHSTYRFPLSMRIKAMFIHSVDEFFSVAKFLVIGAILAAFVQTYVSTNAILSLGEGIVYSTAIMMGLAYLLSLCSEADAFIGASFRHMFPDASLLGFLIYGPMLDLKNTIMMMAVFKLRFVIVLMIIITVTVFSVLFIVHPWI